MEDIEKVKKRATKMIPNLKHIPYRKRLEHLLPKKKGWHDYVLQDNNKQGKHNHG